MEARRIWRDADGRVVLWQRPNIWLAVWAISALGRLVLHQGTIEQGARWVGTAAIIIWALLEILQGVNYFRRLLGLAVLVLSAASILRMIF